MNQERDRLIIVGDGDKECWQRPLAALADHYELSLVSGDYPTWQSAFVEKHRIADTSQYGGLFEAVCDLRGEVPYAGLLPINDRSVPPLAVVARKLRLRFVDADAAASCADEDALEARLTAAGVPAATGGGEVLLCSVVAGGSATPVCAAEVTADGADILTDWRSREWAEEAVAITTAAHRAIGVDWGVTATKIAVGEGIRVAGVRPWLGEEIASTPMGVGLAGAAVDIAFERQPDHAALERLAAARH